jgi:hypothetical protein
MDNFLAELEAITQSYSAVGDSNSSKLCHGDNPCCQDLRQIAPAKQQQPLTNTVIQNQENPENWVNSVAEFQDYQALNQEIESDRTTSKIYIAVGSGLGTLSSSAYLGNWTLEQTYNPTGYMIFSGVLAASIVAAGLSGTCINGRAVYSSPWLLSSIGASAGMMGGAYAVSRPYFEDASMAKKGETAMQTEIQEIEVKPQVSGFDLSTFLIPLIGAAAIAMLFLKK